MASINRTVYPQLAEPKDNAEWRARYDLADDEVWLAKRQVRGGKRTLAFLLLLKTFQNVGYFVDIDAIPQRISDYIRNQLLEYFPTQDPPIIEPARLSKPTLYEYRVAIRQYRGVTAFGDSAREGLSAELTQAAQTMNSTADLINVEVEWLIKERWELPAFSTLDRLAGHIKQTVNDALFERVYGAMTGEQKAICRQMLRQPNDGGGAEWTRLKTLPSNPTPGHMQELNEHFQWLMTLGDIKKTLASVPAAKIMHFASEALSLPPSELGSGGMRMTKRYTFVLCAIHRARVETRDAPKGPSALGDILRKRVAMKVARMGHDRRRARRPQ